MPFVRGFYVVGKNPPSHNEAGESDADSDSDDEDFESHDSSELSALADGSCQSYSASRIKTCVIDVQLSTGKRGLKTSSVIKRIRGRFDSGFMSPCWMIKVEVKEYSSQSKFLTAVGSPSYRIRVDSGVDKSVICLFLDSCGVEPQHVQRFVEFMDTAVAGFCLENIINVLRQFKDSSATNSEIAGQIQAHLINSVPGKALMAPQFTKHVHQLFPNRASKLLASLSSEALKALDTAIQDEPWIFGYRTILYNRYHLLGCEAKLKALIDSKLLGNRDIHVSMTDALFIYYAITQMTYRNGHTYVETDRLKWVRHYRQPFAPVNHNITQWESALDFLVEEEVLGTDEVEGVGKVVYLTKLRYYEESIASSLSELMYKDPWILSGSLREEDFSGDRDQLKAAHLIANSPVVVISGKGGSGKTHVVSKVLSCANTNITCAYDGESTQEYPPPLSCSRKHGNEVECQRDESIRTGGHDVSQVQGKENERVGGDKTETSIGPILLTAPTGRAASILGKRTDIPAFTMHHVIYSFYRHKSESNEGNTCSNSWRFSAVRILVCDECSLVSVRTFSDLIGILLRHANLQQLVLLGDIYQLPSIEPGNFLGDIYDSLEQYGLSITLHKNHRAESEQIVMNSQRISERKVPVFDEKRNFVSLEYNSSTSEDMVVDQTVKELLYRQVFKQENSQFIAFRRKDCLAINEICCQFYNKHPMKDHKGRTTFQIGDKVCIGKNRLCFDVHKKEEVRLCNGEIFVIKDDVTVEEAGKRSKKRFFDVHKKEEVRLCNGEIFVIKDDVTVEEAGKRSKKRFLDLDDGERVLKVEFKELRKAKLRHAWARTIHTCQGSEIDSIVYVVGRPYYQTWQHVYTAVSRGKCSVYIINSPSHLRAAVRTEPTKRNTRLKEFLTKESKHPGERLKAIGAGLTGLNSSTPSGSPLTDDIGDSDDDELLIQASQAIEANEKVSESRHTVPSATSPLTQMSTQVERGRPPANDFDEDCFAFLLDDDDDDDIELLSSVKELEKQDLTAMTAKSDALSICSNSQIPSSENDSFSITRRNLRLKACASPSSDNSRLPQLSETESQDDGSVVNTAWVFRGNNSSLLSPSPPRKAINGPFPSPPWTPERTTPALCSHLSPSGFSQSNMSPSSQTKRPSSQSADNMSLTPSKRYRPIKTAMYPGRCQVCSSPIRAGVDQILRDERKKMWVHIDCVEK